jgi:hypothetical protein
MSAAFTRFGTCAGRVWRDRIVVRQTVCLRQPAEGDRAQEAAIGRFQANEKVTADRLIAGWSELTAAEVAGRHVLAIQDTSKINFRTTPNRPRGLGEIGKGSGRVVLAHAMVAVDAKEGCCLGLIGGSVYTRQGQVETPRPDATLRRLYGTDRVHRLSRQNDRTHATSAPPDRPSS